MKWFCLAWVLLVLPTLAYGQNTFATPGLLPATGVDSKGHPDTQITYTLDHVGEANIGAAAAIGSDPAQDITDAADFTLRQAGYPDRPVDFQRYAQSVANFAGGNTAAGLTSFPWGDFVSRVNDWVKCCVGDLVIPITGSQRYIGSRQSGGERTNLGGIGRLNTPPLSKIDNCARVHDAKMWGFHQFAPGARVHIRIEGGDDIEFVVPKSTDDINDKVIDCFKKNMIASNAANVDDIVDKLSSILDAVTVQYEHNLKGSAKPGVVLSIPVLHTKPR